MPLSLGDVLAGQSAEASQAFESFFNFCRSEYNDENVLFLMRVRVFRGQPAARNLFRADEATLASRANCIYRTHLDPHGDKWINLPATLAIEVKDAYPEGGFEDNSGVNTTFFDRVYHSIFNLTEGDVWLRFKSKQQTPAAPKPAAKPTRPGPIARAVALEKHVRMFDAGLTVAFNAILSSPAMAMVPLTSLGLSGAAPAASASAPLPSSRMPPSCAAAAHAAPEAASASSAIFYHTPARDSSHPREARVAVPLASPLASASSSAPVQVPVLRMNPPPKGKILQPAPPLPVLPADAQAREQAVLNRQAALAGQPLPIPPPPPPTSPVPSIGTAKRLPHPLNLGRR